MASKLSISSGRSDVHHVNVEDLHIDYSQNGRKFQPAPEKVRALAESIIEYGQLEPILIRKVADSLYTPVAGYTRCAAVKLINSDPELRVKAGLDEGQSFPIKAVSLRANEQDAFLRNLVENNQRNATSPIDDAHNQNILRERYGWSNVKIAEFYHCTPAWVSSLSNLLNLDEEHQRLVHEEALSPRNGIELSRLMPDVRDEIIASASKPILQGASIESNGLEGIDFDALERMEIEQAEKQAEDGQPAVTIDNKELSKKIAQARGKTVGRSMKEIKDTLKEIAESNIHSDDVRGVCSATLKWIVGEAIIDDVLDSITDIINSVNV